MVCRVCGNELLEPTDNNHCHERSPVEGDMCASCWEFTVQMNLFHVRGTNMGPGIMGNWTEGWLKEILANPRKHL